MDDRKLLELAAKAAGIKVHGLADKFVAQHRLGPDAFCVANDAGGDSLWNPLTDDGDALRLAAQLELNVTFRTVNVDVSRGNVSASEHTPTYHGQNEATRRAIVRAAAKIGKELK